MPPNCDEQREGHREAHSQRVVLVVEDEVLVRLAIADHLRCSGFVVLEAASAEEARTILTSGAEVDLLFSDVRMENSETGVDLARWVMAALPDLPVMLTSAVSSYAHEAKLAAINLVAFIDKPYEPEAVVERVNAALVKTKPR